MRISTKYISLIGIILFCIIISKADIGLILELILSSDKKYLFLAFLTIPFIIASKSIRWKMIIDTCNLDYSLAESCKASMIGTFVGTITPGKGGDLIRTIYLDDKNPSASSMTTIIIDRIFDLAMLTILSLTGAIIITDYFEYRIGSIYPVLLVPLVLIIIALDRNTTRRIGKIILEKIIPTKNQKYLTDTYHEFYKNTDLIISNTKKLISISFMTILIFMFGFLQTYFAVLSMNIEISALYLFAINPLIGMMYLLPISVSGIGTRDLTIIFFFSLVGIASSYALGASMLSMALVWIELIPGGILWATNPREIKI